MIAIDLSRQEVLDADPRAIKKINLTLNLDREGNKTMFFIIEEEKETVLDFSQRTVKALCVQLSWVKLYWIIFFLPI